MKHRRLEVALAFMLPAMVGVAFCGGAPPDEPAPAELPSIDLSGGPAFPLAAHLESADIAAGTVNAQQLMDAGDELFHTVYNSLDGVGMMRTVGGLPLPRFSAGPTGGGQPIAVTAQSCGSCHSVPVPAGAGLPQTRVLFDADQDGQAPYLARGTTSLLGNGLLQLLAQEMTEELQAARDALAEEATGAPGQRVTRALRAKDVDFGMLAGTGDAAGVVTFDASDVHGVSPDLVVRPYGWKGNVTTLRGFQVLPATFGLGMMAEEFVWRLPEAAGADPDGDGVERELSVGDITALTLYDATLETPASAERLASLGLVAPLDAADRARVDQGRALFDTIGCTECHRPELPLENTVFEEPTQRGNGRYFDAFLASRDENYDAARAVRVDLATEARPPRVETAPAGGATVRLYGDLKRHQMGRVLADTAGAVAPFDATLTPVSQDGQVAIIDPGEFLTAELWGVGTTGPWLHDDRAATLDEAIRLHGEDDPAPEGDPARSEAQASRDAYIARTADEREALVMFLRSLRDFSSRSDADD